MSSGVRITLTIFLVIAVATAAWWTERWRRGGQPKPPAKPQAPAVAELNLKSDSPRAGDARNSIRFDRVTLWQQRPDNLAVLGGEDAGISNVHPDDYSGPESCRGCHKKNYRSWRGHPHRVMNALATDETVKGDFSDSAMIEYLGGVAEFRRKDDRYEMRLRRGEHRLTYAIRQTIGSRFFQYYVGRLVESSDEHDRAYYEDDQVLPFGYWLGGKQWAPIVHVGPELPDGERPDPFALPTKAEQGKSYYVYSRSCNQCHTTFPLADLLIKAPTVVGKFAPEDLHLDAAAFLANHHQDLLENSGESGEQPPSGRMETALNEVARMDAPTHAVTLGISCEACHLGAKRHAEGKLKRPQFIPSSPHLFAEQGDDQHWNRSTGVHWACGRCHTGERPQFASGASTWNSTEYSDARRGSCYSKLTCINCHAPHEATGPQWTGTPDQDDAKCLTCHEQLQPDDARRAHTHHSLGSGGSRCMNCHMPRINEGLQDVVRTHMIFSPTEPLSIESNQPNACNLCHVDKPIDWTVKHLTDWYGAAFSENLIARNYPKREAAVALGWLQSDHESVRLVGADALTRRRAKWALPELLDMLDDPYLLNRQFTLIGLQEMTGKDLSQFGYRFYMTKQERQAPIAKARAALTPK